MMNKNDNVAIANFNKAIKELSTAFARVSNKILESMSLFGGVVGDIKNTKYNELPIKQTYKPKITRKTKRW